MDTLDTQAGWDRVLRAHHAIHHSVQLKAKDENSVRLDWKSSV
jgi:hypothetical protein